MTARRFATGDANTSAGQTRRARVLVGPCTRSCLQRVRSSRHGWRKPR
jgi:hypothetical protein